MKKLILAIVLWALAVPAFAGIPPSSAAPFAAGSQIVPTNGSAPKTAGSIWALLSPFYATTDVGFKPYGNAQLIANRSFVTAVSATFTLAAPLIAGTNTYSSGQQIVFINIAGAVTNITTPTPYFVIATGMKGSTFEVSLTPGGSPVTPNGNGTATANTIGTIYASLEVPSDFTAVKLRFGNILGSTYTIHSMTVAASSQWAAAGGAASNGMMGVSAFDSTGTDITATAGTWQVASFGLNGTDGSWVQSPGDYTNTAASTTATSCSGSTLNVASATGIANGQTAVPVNPVTAASGGQYYHVLGAPSGSAITLDGTVSCANGDSWVFLPITFPVPAATSPTTPAIISTDPVHVISTPRIDGPVISGETPFLDGTSTPLTNGMTANVVSTTSVSLTGGTVPGALATGQILR